MVGVEQASCLFRTGLSPVAFAFETPVLEPGIWPVAFALETDRGAKHFLQQEYVRVIDALVGRIFVKRPKAII